MQKEPYAPPDENSSRFVQDLVIGSSAWFLVGHARTLTALKRFHEAKTELSAAREMSVGTGVTRPNGFARELTEAMSELYDAWHAADPEVGHDAEAAKWRVKLSELEGSSSSSDTG